MGRHHEKIMIHYHGLPITPNSAAYRVLQCGHACLSYPNRGQVEIVIEVSQSWIGDNGAFPAWKAGKPILDWKPFYKWAEDCKRIPNCDFMIIPDIINGNEKDNDSLVSEWPMPKWFGAPVWHMHESMDRLERLGNEWPRICLGSSGEYSTVGDNHWWQRMHKAMQVICNKDGEPKCKLHGLRMLNPKVFTKLPLSSADSTNIARNIGIDSTWNGNYMPIGPEIKDWRALTMRNRIEAQNSLAKYPYINEFDLIQESIF